MVDFQERIAQFKKMTEADPDNELGHFSLARAYMDAGLYADAESALKRVLQLKPEYSKAYLLLGICQKELSETAQAVETLTQGYEVAQERGELMPRNEMGAMLKELGAKVPEMKVATLTPDMAGAGNIVCRRCGRITPKMPDPPFGGEQGAQIHASVCGPCFKEWILQGTKVINELRLNLTEKSGQDIYDQHMKEFLNLE